MKEQFDQYMQIVLWGGMGLLLLVLSAIILLLLWMIINHVLLNLVLKRVLIQLKVYQAFAKYLVHRKKIDEWLRANTREGW